MSAKPLLAAAQPLIAAAAVLLACPAAFAQGASATPGAPAPRPTATARPALVLQGAATPIPQYGPNITLALARKVAFAAQTEARKNAWPVAVAVVDTAGNLVFFERLDDTMTASLRLAIDKAASAAMYRRPTKYFADALAQGGERLGVLMLPGASASDGGVPLYVGGKIVGAVGVSGVSSGQDGQVARAGAAVTK